MLDIAPSEFLLVAFVALVVIGPKDLPKAMRVVGYWVGKARGVARSFRQGFDNMVREAELEEMEKRWAAENARIMAEHSANADSEAQAAAEPIVSPDTPPAPPPAHHDDGVGAPVMVEKPTVAPASTDHAAPRPDATPS